MHAEIEEPHEHADDLKKQASMAFAAIISQIIVIDLVFSIDSIVTAVGMADQVEVMIAAVIVAVGVMFVASGPVADFVAKHPTTKMLALAFLLLIGTSLVADGLGFHIPKGYIYSAMAFSVLVEAVNIFAKERKVRRAGGSPPAQTATVVAAHLAHESPQPAEPVAAAKRKPRSTSASRARSRPKSAPRK
jgi:predicted tellurium resistance membrane protein TerC